MSLNPNQRLSTSHLFDNRYVQSIVDLTSPPTRNIMTEINSRPNEASHSWPIAAVCPVQRVGRTDMHARSGRKRKERRKKPDILSRGARCQVQAVKCQWCSLILDV